MSLSLVTGGSGFIGQHLVDQLVAGGEKVRILDLEPPAVLHPGVEFVQGSVADSRMVREAIGGVRYLYHTAAIPHLWMPDPAMYEETNVVGTRIVLEAARRASVDRVVHTSSATVLVDGRIDRMPTIRNEDHRTQERGLAGHYARSKWRAEQAVLSFADKLPVIIVLPTLPLGPGDRHLTPPGRMLLDFLNGKSRAYADCILNVIDVRDVAAGHKLACMRGRPGRRYILNRHHLGMASFLACLENLTGRPMPSLRIPGSAALMVSAVLELWSTLVSGKAPIAPLAGTRMSLQPIVFDGRRAEMELGLPTTPLAETLIDAAAWFAEKGRLSSQGRDPALAFSDR